MSRHLLGNPHCWPIGALISMGTFIYLIISTIALIVKCILSRERYPSTATVRDVNASSNPEDANRRSARGGKRRAPVVSAIPLSRTSMSTALAVIISAALLHDLGDTCQQGNSDVYEIATCMEWKPLVRIKVQFSLHDMAMSRRVTLRPYVRQKIGDTSFTVISISTPSDQLLKSRFALSEHEALIVPEGDNMPIECSSPDEARDHISNCKNNVFATAMQIQPLHAVIVLMGASPGQVCNISLTEITGCYSCQEGANLIASCTTPTHTWTIIQCDTHVFSVECSPLGKENTITLDFQRAIVKQNCFAECNNRTIHMSLNGSLVYLPHMNDEEIFISNIATWNSTKWFRDWQAIDFGPMLRVVKNHWKASLVILGTVATFSAATYLFGPTIVLAVLQILVKGHGSAKLVFSFHAFHSESYRKANNELHTTTSRGSMTRE
ncbi:sodium pump decarboxylase, gamma subunit [Cooperia oncophora]